MFHPDFRERKRLHIVPFATEDDYECCPEVPNISLRIGREIDAVIRRRGTAVGVDDDLERLFLSVIERRPYVAANDPFGIFKLIADVPRSIVQNFYNHFLTADEPI